MTLGAGCRDEHAQQSLAELRRTLGELAEGGAQAEELERCARAISRRVGEPDAIRGQLDAAVDSELKGIPYLTLADQLAQTEALRPGDVGEAFAEVLASAIVLGPTGTVSPDPALGGLEQDDPEPVEGETFRRLKPSGWRSRRPADLLTVGDRGVTFAGEDGETVTIEWDDLVVVEQRPDGQIRLNARAGAWMELTPYPGEDGFRAFALMREHIPPHTFVPSTDWALAEAIEDLTARRIEDRSVVARPLRALPDELTADEGIADMAIGAKGGKKAGLAVVTAQRVLWLSSTDDECLAVPFSSLAAADARGADLDLRWDGGAERLQIIPAGVAPTLAHAIARERGGGG